MEGSSSSKRKAGAWLEGESSGKMLDVTVGLECLDCTICLKPLRPPIFQCSVGHFICEDCCKDRLDNKCLLCSAETSFKRCFGIEHVVQSVTVACSNDKYGCAEKVTYYNNEEHKKACPYGPCFCPESGCGFAGPAKVLLEHFTTQHKCPLSTLSDSGTVSLCLQPGLHVLQCTGKSYFFLLSMASEPFGHVISVVCVQPNWTESKFTCNMSYDCITSGSCGSTSWHIRSSSLPDGLPTVYDLILPKGKVSDDATGIVLRATIHHQPSCLNRSCFRGMGPTPALQQRPDTYDDDEDNVPLRFSRSRLQGTASTPAVNRIPDSMDDIGDNEEDEIPSALRRPHPFVQQRPDTHDDDWENGRLGPAVQRWLDGAHAEEDDDDDDDDDDDWQDVYAYSPVSLSRPRIGRIVQRYSVDLDSDEDDNIP